MQDISNAINSGKEVTVHEKNINFKGRWNGAGYIILDPTTGAGAYMIGGGLDGGATDVGFFANLLGRFGIMGHNILNTVDPADGTFNFSSRTTWLQFLKSFTKFLGAGAFAFSTFSVVNNSNLSTGNKVGQIVTNLAVGIAMAGVTPLLVGGGLIGIVIGLAVLVSIVSIGYYINSNFFSHRSRYLLNKDRVTYNV